MPTTDDLTSIFPRGKKNVYDILQELHFNVNDWANYKAGAERPAANPRYCYEWSFLERGMALALCVWHAEVGIEDTRIFYSNNVRRPPVGNSRGKLMWIRRAQSLDANIQVAFLNALPVYGIIIAGRHRDRNDPEAIASAVFARSLDPVPWAVVEYDFDTGDFVVERGAVPVKPEGLVIDDETASFPEGEPRRAFRTHRHREAKLRAAKIKDFKTRNSGRLFCEVPRCGFDFVRTYGETGEGFAHVHHLTPLSKAPPAGTLTSIDLLAVVCPNCHAMIHRNGECREIATLIQKVL